MQKYCLSALLPVLFGSLYAQPIVVMLDKINVLYAGVDNPFHIAVSDVAPEHLVLTPSQGTILMDGSGAHRWRLCACTSDEAWLILSDSTLENIIDSVFFRVKRLPEPRFEFAKKGHHSAGSVTGYFDDFCSDYLRPVVVGFDLEYIPEEQDPMIVHNTGARFSGSAAEYIYRLTPGDQIFITGITWRGGCDPTIRKSEEVLGFGVK